jgi:hypothetical protein
VLKIMNAGIRPFSSNSRTWRVRVSNPNQGFDLRSITGAGAGFFLHQSSGGFTVVSVGVVGDRENVTGSSEVTNDAEGLLGFRFSRYRTDFPKRSINLSVSAEH